ncbi:MAG: pyruvate kinase, partial [Acidobacteria bacterium]|nr:pyruvate kinase [Acidobacteriota bacterium]
MRHTKIVATIGPATSGESAIRALIVAGVDVCRLNFSHGTHEAHGIAVRTIRAAAGELGRSVAILQDLSGPKIRTGLLLDGKPIPLEPGDELRIAVGEFVGEGRRVSTPFADLPKAVQPGDRLLLDDGRIQLRVERVESDEMVTTVIDGGLLGEHKGINAPGVMFPSSALTDKDIEDLKFGVSIGVDLVALSFVHSGADLRQARDVMRAAGAPAIPLIAKLERPEAIARLEEILHESDAVMVARGDLGLELPLERVPRVQKEVTRRARALGIPVIVATQVLESMVTQPRPTRAEVSDAANAVDDGVDAIMLAGETAMGKHPIEAVETLDRIIRDAETMPATLSVPLMDDSHVMPAHGQAICEAAVTLAGRGEANAIVAVTRRGKTARMLSALRPRAPIYAATDQADVARRLALSWGVVPLLTDLSGDVNAAATRIGAQLVERGVIPSSSVIVLVSITPDLSPGQSNFLKLLRV